MLRVPKDDSQFKEQHILSLLGHNSEKQVIAAHTLAKGMNSFSKSTRASHSKVSCILVV